jgi:formylmethanofuran dehydrogenase subunit E
MEDSVMALEELLQECALRHGRLCPRQVLGVRMGLAGAQLVGLEAPRTDKLLLVIMETDGCFASGIEVATGCTVGHRTLRVEDYGKVAATFIHAKTGQAVRLSLRPGIREQARSLASPEKPRYFTQLEGYKIMPAEDLFVYRSVELVVPVRDIIGRPGVRVNCDYCGEEIINQREIRQGGLVVCAACARRAYYEDIESASVDLLEVTGRMICAMAETK